MFINRGEYNLWITPSWRDEYTTSTLDCHVTFGLHCE